jgi:hypothetical protein
VSGHEYEVISVRIIVAFLHAPSAAQIDAGMVRAIQYLTREHGTHEKGMNYCLTSVRKEMRT